MTVALRFLNRMTFENIKSEDPIDAKTIATNYTPSNSRPIPLYVIEFKCDKCGNSMYVFRQIDIFYLLYTIVCSTHHHRIDFKWASVRHRIFSNLSGSFSIHPVFICHFRLLCNEWFWSVSHQIHRRKSNFIFINCNLSTVLLLNAFVVFVCMCQFVRSPMARFLNECRRLITENLGNETNVSDCLCIAFK